jgi:hypothetical protein
VIQHELVPGVVVHMMGYAGQVPAPTILTRIQAQLTAHERKLLEMLLADPECGDAIAADFAKKPVDEVVAFIRRGGSARRPLRRRRRQWWR